MDPEKKPKVIRSTYSPKKLAEDDEEPQENSEDEEIAYRKKIEQFKEQLEKEKNLVRHKIYKRRYEQQVFGGYLKDLDDLVNKPFTEVKTSSAAGNKQGDNFKPTSNAGAADN